MQNILEIRDLGRSYVNFRLEHISLSIPGGTIMGLVGENGAGKSTTIRAALGLIRKDAGEVLYCGEPLTTDSAAMKEQIGVVFDSICFYPELTVEKAGRSVGKPIGTGMRHISGNCWSSFLWIPSRRSRRCPVA